MTVPEDSDDEFAYEEVSLALNVVCELQLFGLSTQSGKRFRSVLNYRIACVFFH